MKNQIIFLLLLVAGWSMACRKENQQEVNVHKLQGRWEAEKRLHVRFENGKETERKESAISPNEQALEFVGDSLLVYSDGKRTSERYTFIVNGENLDIREENTTEHLRLKWYSDRQIAVYTEEVSVNDDGVEIKYNDGIVLAKK